MLQFTIVLFYSKAKKFIVPDTTAPCTICGLSVSQAKKVKIDFPTKNE